MATKKSPYPDTVVYLIGKVRQKGPGGALATAWMIKLERWTEAEVKQICIDTFTKLAAADAAPQEATDGGTNREQLGPGGATPAGADQSGPGGLGKGP